MLSNYYTLRYIASTLDSTLRGKRIREIYSQNKDELVVAFADNLPHLVFLCRQDAATMYLHEGMARARKNSLDLLSLCAGQEITGVSIRQSDRIVTLGLDSGTTITALLFGAQSNVVLLDTEGTVLDAFKNRTRLKGTVVRIPEREAQNNISLLRTAAGAEGAAAIAAVIKKVFPALGSTLAHETAVRAGVFPSQAASSLDAPSLDALDSALRTVMRDLESPTPRVYLRADADPAFFSIIPLRQAAEMHERLFGDIHEAVRFFLARRNAAEGIEEEKGTLLASLRKKIEKLQRTQRAIDADARSAERADEYERFAALLMANLHAFAKGSRSVTLPTQAGAARIPLEPALTPVQNAQRYYEKAKHSHTAARETAARAGELEREIARGEQLFTAADQCVTREQVKAFMNDHAAELDEFGVGKKAKAQEQLPFRIFTVDGGFEVWAGKNGATNDLLTLRHAKADDLWFHARGSSGSHVVLKIHTGKGEPGKKAREQAAGIAAYYSKMKNAKLVPVAMTEKRYVRKPKGSPPGTVAIEREKVIFAQPGLPPKGND